MFRASQLIIQNPLVGTREKRKNRENIHSARNNQCEASVSLSIIVTGRENAKREN